MASKQPARETLLVASFHGRTAVHHFRKSKDRAALSPDLREIMDIDFKGEQKARGRSGKKQQTCPTL